MDNDKQWFDSRMDFLSGDVVEHIRLSVESFKFKVEKKDPAGAALTFVL